MSTDGTTTGETKDEELNEEEAVAPGTPLASSSDGDRNDGADEGPPLPSSEEPADESPRDRRYRQQLRQVERERDALRAALADHVRGRVERLATERGLADGSAVWLLGDDPLRYLNEAYGVDGDRVKEVVDALLRRAPRLRATVPSYDGGARQEGATGASWRRVLGGGAS